MEFSGPPLFIRKIYNNIWRTNAKLELGNILHHQYRIIHKNGDIRWVQDYTIPTLDDNGKLIQLNGLTSDITEQKVLKEKIKYLSDYDPLTKLPNRQKFIDKVTRTNRRVR